MNLAYVIFALLRPSVSPWPLFHGDGLSGHFAAACQGVSTKALFSGIVAAGVLFAGTWCVIRADDGFPQRYTNQLRTILAVKSEGYNSNCFDTESDAAEIYALCRVGASIAVKPDFSPVGRFPTVMLFFLPWAAALHSGRSGVIILAHDCQPFAAELSCEPCVRSGQCSGAPDFARSRAKKRYSCRKLAESSAQRAGLYCSIGARRYAS